MGGERGSDVGVGGERGGDIGVGGERSGMVMFIFSHQKGT